MSNPRDIRGYLVGRERLWGAELEAVRPADFLLETLMMGLRLEEGISAGVFARRFGSPFQEVFPGLWESWVSRGAARPAGERLALSDSGRMMLDGLLSEMPHEPDARTLTVSWP